MRLRRGIWKLGGVCARRQRWWGRGMCGSGRQGAGVAGGCRGCVRYWVSV